MGVGFGCTSNPYQADYKSVDLQAALFDRYTIINDLTEKGFLTSPNASEDLWPKLLYRYSTSGEVRQLPMVYGEFQ